MRSLLQHWVTEQAERRPDAPALVMNEERINYGQFEEYSNRLARLLKEAGCKKGDRVCFLIPKSPAAYISMLGILKADCVHVGWMGADAAAGRNFEVRFSRGDLESCSAAPLDYQNTREDPAHILFTSGSTGTPKGVVITHSNVIHFIDWANRYFGICSSDRLSAHPPLHFDLSTFDMFGAFAAGAELHLAPPTLNLLLDAMVFGAVNSELYGQVRRRVV